MQESILGSRFRGVGCKNPFSVPCVASDRSFYLDFMALMISNHPFGTNFKGYEYRWQPVIERFAIALFKSDVAPRSYFSILDVGRGEVGRGLAVQ